MQIQEKIMHVKDIMSAPVTSCTIDSNVGRVRDLMYLKGFSALPVVEVHEDEIKIKGIVTYRDVAGVYDDNISVRQVMTQRVWVIPPHTNVKTAADLMRKKEIHHLVVVDQGRIVGLLSSADFVELVSKFQLC
ncbi:MAG: CBS domain-containing protein [Saprospiraceae bacterium]|nr:CBS domain-containing protein [Saprospiraceae bacterium]